MINREKKHSRNNSNSLFEATGDYEYLIFGNYPFSVLSAKIEIIASCKPGFLWLKASIKIMAVWPNYSFSSLMYSLVSSYIGQHTCILVSNYVGQHSCVLVSNYVGQHNCILVSNYICRPTYLCTS